MDGDRLLDLHLGFVKFVNVPFYVAPVRSPQTVLPLYCYACFHCIKADNLGSCKSPNSFLDYNVNK